jgi:hypothetical protein
MVAIAPHPKGTAVKRKRIVATGLAMLVVAGAGYLALGSFGFLAPAREYRPVPAGHREIIFLAPATSGEAWERLVAAVDALCQESLQSGGDKPRLNVAKERAFTDLTADVPEVSLWPDGCEDARLWIRWCKLSAESNSEKWISRLSGGARPPLGVIAGDTSFRALRAAEALQRHRGDWQGPPPLLLLTTATAESYVPHNKPNVATTDKDVPRQLLDVYEGRTFRFSFANSRMAAAVLDFVRTHDESWPSGTRPANLATKSAAACAAPHNPLAVAVLAATADDLFTTYLYSLKWDDDSFSADLADRFRVQFLEAFPRPRVSPYQIEYSVGDFYQPNPREAFVVGQLLPELKATRERRQLMLLPADAERARRFLHTVVRRSAPVDLNNLVVLACDSLSFNTILRDRNVAWNIQDLPVPLVMFSHRNPVAEDVGFKETTAAGATGTEDLLLYRDIVETLLLTAYRDSALTASSDEVAIGLHQLSWANGRVRPPPADAGAPLLFNPRDGNRHDGTGEHIIILRPDSDDRGLLAQASITVWQLRADTLHHTAWRKVRTLTVTYDSLAPGSP